MGRDVQDWRLGGLGLRCFTRDRIAPSLQRHEIATSAFITSKPMTHPYWQAKIWALLHDPPLKALRAGAHLAEEGPWGVLKCMESWYSPKVKTSQQTKNPRKNPRLYDNSRNNLQKKWLDHVAYADLIASASDRTSIGRLDPKISAVTYQGDRGIEIAHLLSGAKSQVKIDHDRPQLADQEANLIPPAIRNCEDARKVFWWLWRCYPQAIARTYGETVHLLPAETRLPDGSLWSHVSMTSALAGGLAGYHPQTEDYPQKNERNVTYSRPQVMTFTFSPVQDFVKASRKMRDFWAGSWTLHYLSARVCWDLAWKYGPDVLLYPCLYGQPLIDRWLVQKYPDFEEWIAPPSDRALRTAGFPNVIAAILPNNGCDAEAGGSPVEKAAQQAEQSLKKAWKQMGDGVLGFLQQSAPDTPWQRINRPLWDRWLAGQWQLYWTALPLGDPALELKVNPRKEAEFESWCEQQNQLTAAQLLEKGEKQFVEAVFGLSQEDEASDSSPANPGETKVVKQPNLNVGSWWSNTFDRVRFSLAAVKNARTWAIPTAFGPRSSISGFGPVITDRPDDWVTESEAGEFWGDARPYFDRIEQLNPSEVIKRVMPYLLKDLLELEPSDKPWRPEKERDNLYVPDLSSGAVGWYRRDPQTYHHLAQRLFQECPWLETQYKNVIESPWGIPHIDRQSGELPPNPRIFNPGWLGEDLDKEDVEEDVKAIQTALDRLLPNNNPTDWYVLAKGDGDSMSEWLKGKKLQAYQNYLPQALLDKLAQAKDQQPQDAILQAFDTFKKETKRMGPATHSALSRSLLDFANQLLPYLTEERYAGRLIYGGGDDVFAYTNLWEWDAWLWDVRQCFRGDEDPQGQFTNDGHYWQWCHGDRPENLADRPLFTLGKEATISFGVVIASAGVPLAIALDHLNEAEEAAKEHQSSDEKKDAVEVRVIYGNGNILRATAKFKAFQTWQSLVKQAERLDLEPALFEQAAQLWQDHPAPEEEAIAPWVALFCKRREGLKGDLAPEDFQDYLRRYLTTQWTTTESGEAIITMTSNWLKLAAFVLRKRKIEVK